MKWNEWFFFYQPMVKNRIDTLTGYKSSLFAVSFQTQLSEDHTSSQILLSLSLLTQLSNSLQWLNTSLSLLAVEVSVNLLSPSSLFRATLLMNTILQLKTPTVNKWTLTTRPASWIFWVSSVSFDFGSSFSSGNFFLWCLIDKKSFHFFGSVYSLVAFCFDILTFEAFLTLLFLSFRHCRSRRILCDAWRIHAYRPRIHFGVCHQLPVFFRWDSWLPRPNFASERQRKCSFCSRWKQMWLGKWTSSDHSRGRGFGQELELSILRDFSKDPSQCRRELLPTCSWNSQSQRRQSRQ